MSTGQRLREERERLGLNQVDFGAVGGVKKVAQINYEKGERQPDAAYLSAVAAAGVDVLYVLTGVRSGSWEVMAQLRAATELAKQTSGSKADQAEVQDMVFAQLRARAPTPRQAKLLALFDQAEEDGKKLIEATAAMAAKAGPR